MSRPTHEPKHLLDTPAEQNIGNGVIVQPQAGGATVVPQTNPDRILMLSGPSHSAQTTSIAITASRIVGPDNPNPGFPGPITGVIEFGNGGQSTKVEVDIPIGPFAGFFNQLSPSVEPQDGGVIVTVPTGVLRVYARYDNQFIQPRLTLPPSSLAQGAIPPVPFIGPGGPVTRAHNTAPSEPIRVKAMAAYYSRHTSKVYRTHYLLRGRRLYWNCHQHPGNPSPVLHSSIRQISESLALPSWFTCNSSRPRHHSLRQCLQYNGSHLHICGNSRTHHTHHRHRNHSANPIAQCCH